MLWGCSSASAGDGIDLVYLPLGVGSAAQSLLDRELRFGFTQPGRSSLESLRMDEHRRMSVQLVWVESDPIGESFLHLFPVDRTERGHGSERMGRSEPLEHASLRVRRRPGQPVEIRAADDAADPQDAELVRGIEDPAERCALQSGLTDAQCEAAAALYAAPPLYEQLGRFLAGRTIRPRVPLAVPVAVARGFFGLDSVSLTLEGEGDWAHRRVLRFAVDARDSAIAGMGPDARLDGSGLLRVDRETGRPLSLSLLGRGRLAPHGRGLLRLARVYAFSDAPTFGLDLDLIAPTAPAGALRSLALLDGGRKLAALTEGGQLSLWDLDYGGLAEVRAHHADWLAADPERGYLQAWGRFTGQGFEVSLGSELEPFGGFVVSRDPLGAQVRVVASMGLHSLLGLSDGRILVVDLGNKEVRTETKVSQGPIQALAVAPEARRLISLDGSGVLRLHVLDFDASACDGFLDAFCKGAPVNLGPGVELGQLPADAAIGLALSPDASHYAYADRGTGEAAVIALEGSRPVERQALSGRLVRFLDGDRVVTDRGVWRVGSQAGRTPLAPVPDDWSAMAVDPREDLVFAAAGDAILRLDASGGGALEPIRARTLPVRDALMHGGRLFVLDDDGLELLDLAERERHALVALRPGSTAWLRRAGDRVYLIVQEPGQGPRVRAFDGVDGQELGRWDTLGLDQKVSAVALSLSGRRLALALEPIGLAWLELQPGGGTVRPMTQMGRLTDRLWEDAAAAGGGASASLLAATLNAPGESTLVSDLAFEVGDDDRLIFIGSGLGQPPGQQRLVRLHLVSGQVLGERTLVAESPRIALDPAGERLALAPAHDPKGAVWNPRIPVVEVCEVETLEPILRLEGQWLGSVRRLVFSPDGGWLFLGAADGRLYRWDLTSGVLAQRRPAHAGAVDGLSLATDGATLLVSAGEDGLIRFWDPGGVAPEAIPEQSFRLIPLIRPLGHQGQGSAALATLARIGSDDLAIALPDGYYLATKGALRHLGFRRDGALFDFERLDLWLNRPDLVLERLGVLDATSCELLRAAHHKRLARFGLGGERERFWEVSAPTIRVEPHPRRVSGVYGELGLVIEAPEGLSRLALRANGVPLVERALVGTHWRGTVRLPLARGANRVDIAATDRTGARSPREGLTLLRGDDGSGDGAAARPELWVVGIGVSRYRDPALALDYAAKDAHDLTGFLAAGGPLYGAVHTRLWSDRQVTREALAEVNAFLRAAAPDDRVLLFLAGHGFLDAGLDYVFGTFDVDPLAPGKTGIRERDLARVFEGVAAQRRLVLIDSCHAGEVDPTLGAQDVRLHTPAGLVSARARSPLAVGAGRGWERSFEVMRSTFADLDNDTGASVLAAAGGLELAIEGDRYQNGVFTFSVLEALRGVKADRDGDGRLRVSELIDYVAGRVAALTGGRQRPNIRAANPYLDFDLY